MIYELVTMLVPFLAKRSEEDFNVFTVMHHGTHEKQRSNVIAWLLDAKGTHECGNTFLRLFLDEVNRALGPGDVPIDAGSFSVRQEVNTSEQGESEDIADLVLEDPTTVIVVENYYTSSGHGHGYGRYLKFGQRDGKRSVVVLLCENVNSAVQTDGWEKAPVVTYAALLDSLALKLEDHGDYKRKYPAQHSFIIQMQRHFSTRGRRMEDQGLIGFIDALCKTGEAARFRAQKKEDAAIQFADHLREAAKQSFDESRDLLRRIKKTLGDYGKGTLQSRINAAMNEQYVGIVSAEYAGIYQWTINFRRVGDNGSPMFQLKFGPSAWYAIAEDTKWAASENPGAPDYTHLFITCNKTIRQSVVTMQEVVNGISPDDTRLLDEVLEVIRRPH